MPPPTAQQTRPAHTAFHQPVLRETSSARTTVTATTATASRAKTLSSTLAPAQRRTAGQPIHQAPAAASAAPEGTAARARTGTVVSPPAGDAATGSAATHDSAGSSAATVGAKTATPRPSTYTSRVRVRRRSTAARTPARRCAVLARLTAMTAATRA
ncbi:hypothetical protein MPTA5024_12385 [Microbispora sp. ATCC PTA-5024]|nr:hypothetical protein MPTA5024_12385 [Microbispora sp. ATCC PTA-5024]